MAPPFAPGRRCRSIEIWFSGGSPSPRSPGQYRGDLYESARSSRPPAIQPDRCDRTVAFSWSTAMAIFGLPEAPITWSERVRHSDRVPHIWLLAANVDGAVAMPPSVYRASVAMRLFSAVRSIAARASLEESDDRHARRRMRLRRGALSPRQRADVRALLPLPRLPAPDRQRLRDQRADRDRPDPAAVGSADAAGDADRQRPAARHSPLPGLPDGAVERLWPPPRAALRARRHARHARGAVPRCPHFHPLEAALDRA